MAFTDHTWTCPVGVTAVLVEVWGAGGGGRIGSNAPLAGPGGGGGAYARKAGIAVTAGLGYLSRVANQSPSGTTGDDSLFINGGTLKAVGGGGATFLLHGSGGSSASCVGDTKYSGGDGGGDGTIGVAESGYGGGASAGDTGNGLPGGHPSGGLAATRAGSGGSGGAVDVDGNPGTGPGGGGGGGGSGSSRVQTSAGTGEQGALLIWDDSSGAGWPPVASGPIATYGAPVADLVTRTTYGYIA